MRRIAVIGIGNILMRDDGIGIHAIKSLGELPIPQKINLKIIDGGLEPDLTVLVDEGVAKLILVDAIQAGGPPGDVYRYTIKDIENSTYQARSTHSFNIKQSLTMMQIVGSLPKDIVIIGVQPKDMSPGTELSPEIAEKIPEVLEKIKQEIF